MGEIKGFLERWEMDGAGAHRRLVNPRFHEGRLCRGTARTSTPTRRFGAGSERERPGISAWGQVSMQASHHRVAVPAGLGEKAMQHPCGNPHGLGEILCVVPLLGLHHQGLEIVPAALPPLLAAKSRCEEGMRSLKTVVEPLEARRIHHLNRPQPSGQLSCQTTRRCSIRGCGKFPLPRGNFQKTLPSKR